MKNEKRLFSVIVMIASTTFQQLPSRAEDHAIEWLSYQDIDKQTKRLIHLDEEESVDNVEIAHVRLKKNTDSNRTDSVFVYNFNTLNCGSGGCLLQIFSENDAGVMQLVFEVTSGSGRGDDGEVDAGISLGQKYSKGMRNIRFDDQITWKWNGETYEVK